MSFEQVFSERRGGLVALGLSERQIAILRRIRDTKYFERIVAAEDQEAISDLLARDYVLVIPSTCGQVFAHMLTARGYDVAGSRTSDDYSKSWIWRVEGGLLGDEGVHQNEDGWRTIDGKKRWKLSR
jgi:hypothetical protein